MSLRPHTVDGDLDPAVFERATHGVIVLDDILRACNPRFCAIVGRSPESLVGRSLLEACPQVQSDGAFSSERWQRRAQAARAGLPQWFPWQFRHGDGRRIHVLVHLACDPRTGRFVADVHDLSNLREAGWIKPESHARLQDVLDHTKAVIFVKDTAGRYMFANRELERVARMPAEQIVGRTDAELWPPDIARHFRANDAQVLEQRCAIEFEVTAEVAHQLKTFLSFKFPLVSPDGEPYAVCGIATDITDRKRTQDALTSAALAVSSARGATVFQELVRYLATILDAEAAFISVPRDGNDASVMRMQAFYLDGEVRENFEYRLAGTPCETVLGETFRIYPSALCSDFPDDLDFRRLGFESYAGFPLHDGSGEPLGLVSVVSRRPMTNVEFVESILKIFAVRAAAELERQRAEETLRASEASYRAIFEASEDAVFVHDWDTGAIIDVNVRACEVYGYTADELKCMSVADVSSGEPPYTAAEAARCLEEAKSGRTVRTEWRRRNKDGSLHWDEVVLRPAVIAGRRRVLAFTREITERKQAEHALRQAQKMEALGHLTGGVAHDFNNLLTSIMGYVVLASEHPAAGAEARLRKYLEQAQFSCERARDLIQQMLTFSRGRRGEPRPVALASLIGQSLTLFSSSVPAGVAIEVQLDRDTPSVLVDPVQLDQVLLNLCLNARDAMSGAGAIRVRVASAPEGEHVCTACRQHASGRYVELCVEDDGPGIPPEILDRIFEPFFTTKDVGKGSGMGLASVHGIVHELGGHILVDTSPGAGTRFRVLFPALGVAPGGQALRTAGAVPAPVRKLCGRVLVVDDERAVAAFMMDLLESWGLDVVQAANGAEALAFFAKAAVKCDLVITDQRMPRMTGMQLAARLVALQPTLPVILYTGLNEGLAAGDVQAAGVKAVITKPVAPQALFALLQAHLPQAE